MTPVEALNSNPAGNAGDIEYVRAPVPPEAVTVVTAGLTTVSVAGSSSVNAGTRSTSIRVK